MAIRDWVFDRIDPLHEGAVAHRRLEGIDVFLGEARFAAPSHIFGSLGSDVTIVSPARHLLSRHGRARRRAPVVPSAVFAETCPVGYYRLLGAVRVAGDHLDAA